MHSGKCRNTLRVAGRPGAAAQCSRNANMKVHCARQLLYIVTLAIGAVASEFALAQTTTSAPVSGTCSGGVQLCNNIATLNVSTTGLLQAQFIGASTLCSNIRIHFLVDGNEVAVTPFVGASGSSGIFNLGPVSSGSHILGLQAEGQVGGCNSGALASWAGTVQVTTTALILASQPVPSLSEWGFILLVTLCGILGGWRLRARGRGTHP